MTILLYVATGIADKGIDFIDAARYDILNDALRYGIE